MLRLYSIISLAVLAIPSCQNTSTDCDHTIVKRVIIHTNNLQAIRIRIDCGATTTPSSSIRLFESADTTDNGKPENTILAEAAGTDIYWKNSDTLVITGVDTTKIDLLKKPYQILNSNKAITVIYQN